MAIFVIVFVLCYYRRINMMMMMKSKRSQIHNGRGADSLSRRYKYNLPSTAANILDILVLMYYRIFETSTKI